MTNGWSLLHHHIYIKLKGFCVGFNLLKLLEIFAKIFTFDKFFMNFAIVKSHHLI